MELAWLNGALMLRPETDIESEALLVILSNLHYVRPSGYDEDGRHKPATPSGQTDGIDPN